MKITASQFQSEVLNGTSLIVFSTATSPKLPHIIQQLKSFPRVFIVDIEEERELAAQYNIRISPIVYKFIDGKVINTYKQTELDKLICLTKS